MIDVVIPQWNQREKTLTCVRSIRKFAPGVRLILIDNGSAPDQRVDGELRQTDILIRNPENVGFVRAANQGLEASDADYVVLQNNDTEIYSDIYARMVRVFEREPSYGALGPVTSECGSWQSIDRMIKVWSGQTRRTKLVTPTEQQRRDVERLHQVRLLHDHALRASRAADVFADQVVAVRGMLAFFCTMFQGSAIENVGPLDTDYGLGFGDDDDYCDRLHAAGWMTGVVPGCYVHHDHRTTFKEHFSPVEIQKMQADAYVTLKRKRDERARTGGRGRA